MWLDGAPRAGCVDDGVNVAQLAASPHTQPGEKNRMVSLANRSLLPNAVNVNKMILFEWMRAGEVRGSSTEDAGFLSYLAQAVLIRIRR